MKLTRAIVKNFLRHNDTDLAAGLTYYSVLAIFPAALALVSLLAVVGQSGDVYNTVVDVLSPLLSDKTMHDIEPTLRTLTQAQGASWTLLVGGLGALWSASAYVGAFARANNTVREVEETRPFWKLRPLMVLITLVTVVLNAAALVIVVATGAVAQSLGDKIGLGNSFLDVWDIAKWPGLAVIVIIVVALLIHATPNYRTGIRLLSPGAFVAILIWAAASVGFAFYVANFSSYNKTYGSVAGVIVALVWLWLTNVALLFGAEIDAERERRTTSARAEEEPIGRPESDVVPVDTPEDERRRHLVEHVEAVYGPMPQPVPDED
ncbi:MAG TPA: YihY/virulence factor BrkB family protein [Marmoricola sp.]|nr:YihY/virulence factor BrkB family protein [Marmoricola sp.]